MSKMLLIDTCTERGLIALSDGDKIVWCEYLPFGLHSSGALMPTLERGLANMAWTSESLDAIGVTVGPGSYTGIRVGATVGQAMSFAQGLPLIGICSLQGYVPAEEGAFAAVIDAKIGGAYVYCAEKVGGQITNCSIPKLVSLENMRDFVGERHLLSPKVQRLKERLAEVDPDWEPQWSELSPSPEALLSEALSKLEAGDYSKNGRLELMYLRKTQAEIEREAAEV